MEAPIDWLLEGDPYIEYRTRLDLLGQQEQDPQVKLVRKAMLEDPRVVNLVKELDAWPGKVIASHKSAGQPFHKLTFLADLGLQVDDPGMKELIVQILKNQSAEGPFQLPMNISESYGGNGQEKPAWALCDAPLILYALVKFGLKDEPSVQKAITYLVGLTRENGWPCAVSKELGKFRGPGRKEDPCPFATLAMLKLLTEVEEWREGSSCHQGVELFLSLWTESNLRHPYMFFMGTDFRKLKVPFIWYDLIHLLEVITKFPWVRNDDRLKELMESLMDKADPQGRFTLGSIWTAWKDWEFGQKKEPSRWLTLISWRIIKRVELIP